VSNPKLKKENPPEPKLRPGWKLGERDVKSECNAMSFQDHSIMCDHPPRICPYKENDSCCDSESSEERKNDRLDSISKLKIENKGIFMKTVTIQKSLEVTPDSEPSNMSESQESKHNNSVPEEPHTNNDSNSDACSEPSNTIEDSSDRSGEDHYSSDNNSDSSIDGKHNNLKESSRESSESASDDEAVIDRKVFVKITPAAVINIRQSEQNLNGF